MAASVTKRTCKFTEDLQKEFSFLQKCLTPTEVRCNKCNETFCRNDIQSTKNHLPQWVRRHHLTTYFRHKKYGDKEAELEKAEGLWAFHTVCHDHSFRSMKCTFKLIQKVFDKKVSCGKTKCEAIATNVIASYSADILKSELNDVPTGEHFAMVLRLIWMRILMQRRTKGRLLYCCIMTTKNSGKYMISLS